MDYTTTFNPETLAVSSFAELRFIWQQTPGSMRADQLAANVAAAIAWGPVQVDVVRRSDFDGLKDSLSDFLSHYGVEIHGETSWPARTRVVLRRLIECPGEYQGNVPVSVTQYQAAA